MEGRGRPSLPITTTRCSRRPRMHCTLDAWPIPATPRTSSPWRISSAETTSRQAIGAVCIFHHGGRACARPQFMPGDARGLYGCGSALAVYCRANSVGEKQLGRIYGRGVGALTILWSVGWPTGGPAFDLLTMKPERECGS